MKQSYLLFQSRMHSSVAFASRAACTRPRGARAPRRFKGSAQSATPRFRLVIDCVCVRHHSGQRPQQVKMTTTLRRSVVNEEEEQEWAWVQPTLSKRQSERAVKNWHRLMVKTGFLMTVAPQETLLNQWEDQASPGPSRTVPEGEKSKKGKNVTRSKRRDDLNYVGDPMAPTGKKYPLDRLKCLHRHEDGLSMMTAGGGRGADGPMYWWVCQGCGSRWKRITKEQAKKPPAPPAEPPPARNTKKPLQPRLTPDQRRTPEPNPREEKFQEHDVEMELIPGPASSATGSGTPSR